LRFGTSFAACTSAAEATILRRLYGTAESHALPCQRHSEHLPKTLAGSQINYYSWVRRAAQFFHGLISCCLLLALSACYSNSRPPRIGTAAPDFTVQDSQNKFTLSQFRGQVLVLNFWATWCAPCVEEIPSLVEMQRRMKAKDVTVLAVSVDVNENAYRQFVKDHNVNLLTVRDPSGNSNHLYGTFKFPETYVIDRGGVMRRKFIGAVDWTEADITEFLGKL
jgi:cytochrome c biogenesis protein CcmG/thiol:disulfide interchange protein DsbE